MIPNCAKHHIYEDIILWLQKSFTSTTFMEWSHCQDKREGHFRRKGPLPKKSYW